MWPHPDDPLLPRQRSWCGWEFQVLVQSSLTAVQESVAPPIVVMDAISERAIVEAVVVNPIRDSLHRPWPRQCRDVLRAGHGHVGGPRLRSKFCGYAISIYGRLEGETGIGLDKFELYGIFRRTIQ